jgi:hypothetical protein
VVAHDSGDGRPRPNATSRLRFLAMGFGVAGFVSLIVGYLGVSAEGATLRDQLSYIASGGFVGLFLLGVGATIAILDGMADHASATREVRDILFLLYGDLSDEVSEQKSGSAVVEVDLVSESFEDGTLFALEGSRRAHRPGCSLVAGKAGILQLTEAEAVASGLLPCRVCEPDINVSSDALPATDGSGGGASGRVGRE